MSDLRSPWLRARGQVMFLLGLILASVIILRVERAQFVPVADVMPLPTLLQPSAVEASREWALIERNTDPATSLVALEDGSRETSLAGIGYAIKAALAAHRLNFITGEELHRRVTALIEAGSRVSADDRGRALSITTGRALETDAAESRIPYESALEIVAWGYPSLRGQAIAELHRWSGVPIAVSGVGAPITPLQRASQILVRAGVLSRGDRQ